MPAVRVFKRGDQFFDGSFAQARGLRLFEAVRSDAVNAPAIVAAVQVERFFDALGKGPGMLDDLAIQLDDVESAVWTIGKLDWTAPGIVRSDKFDGLFTRRALGFDVD